jgi:hypothetical protein
MWVRVRRRAMSNLEKKMDIPHCAICKGNVRFYRLVVPSLGMSIASPLPPSLPLSFPVWLLFLLCLSPCYTASRYRRIPRRGRALAFFFSFSFLEIIIYSLSAILLYSSSLPSALFSYFFSYLAALFAIQLVGRSPLSTPSLPLPPSLLPLILFSSAETYKHRPKRTTNTTKQNGITSSHISPHRAGGRGTNLNHNQTKLKADLPRTNKRTFTIEKAVKETCQTSK